MESNPIQKDPGGRTPLTPSLSPSDGERVADLSAVARRAKAEGRVKGPGGSTDPRSQVVSGGFEPLGLILAGGFVRHPVIPGVRLMRRMNAALPGRALRGLLRVYARYAGLRHWQAAETLGDVGEFMANRLVPGDQAAIVHRLDLIAGHDPRPIAKQSRLPVRYLTALIDPLVPWPFVRPWLQRNCPGYLGGNTIPSADHNVLGTAPRAAARLVLEWMTGERGLCD